MHRLSLIAPLAVILASSAGTVNPHAAQRAETPAPRPRARAFTPAKTPWGDPDLQGNYTNKYELGTPFERPPEFEGRRVDDVSPSELEAAVKKRQETQLANSIFLGGDPEQDR